MLSIASSTAPSARLQQASLYDEAIPQCRAVIAIGEPLSYSTDPESEPPTLDLFTRVATALPPGGVFLFDVLTRHSADVSGYRSWSSGDDWACLVEVTPHPNGHAIRRAITTFRLVGTTYRRGAEEHWAHLFSVSTLRRQLKQTGFTVRTASRYGRALLAPGRRLFNCLRVRS